MTIYLDIILCENLLMNYIILFATYVITKPKTKHAQIRMILSSLLGSIYAIIVYLNILSIYTSIIAKVTLSITMVYIAFAPNNIKQLLKHILIFYLVSFIFGGCTFALIYFIKPENVQIKNGVFVGLYPIKVGLIAGVIAFIITQIAFKINKSRLNNKNAFVEIELINKNKNVKTKALIDSGNMLKEPISKKPVIIVEKAILSKIIPEEVLDYVEKIVGGEKQEKNNIQEYLSKIRIVPFMSLGKENGMLVGIKIDKIKIKTEDTKIEKENVIAGIYDKKLTKDNKYNALIGLNILEGEHENELVTNTKK